MIIMKKILILLTMSIFLISFVFAASITGSAVNDNDSKDAEIQGTKEELGRLQLNEQTKVWDVMCVVIEEKKESKKRK